MDFEHILDDLYLQLNDCRSHPREAANQLGQLKKLYNGKLFRDQIKTREGPIALDNLIHDLSARAPIANRLKWSFALHMVADEQATVLGEQGLFTTEGTRLHRSLPERVKDYAVIKGRLSEVYEFGGRTPQEILEELLIDDGLVSRKRRNTLLDPVYKYIGIGSSYHETNEACTVIILAEDIISLVAPDSNGKYKKRTGISTGQQNVVKLTDQILLNNVAGQVVRGTFSDQTGQGQLPNVETVTYGEPNRNTNISVAPSNEPHFILEPNRETQNSINPQERGSNINTPIQNNSIRQTQQSGYGGETVEYGNNGDIRRTVPSLIPNEQGSVVTYEPSNSNYQPSQHLSSSLENNLQNEQYEYYKRQQPEVYENPRPATLSATDPHPVPAPKESKCAIM